MNILYKHFIIFFFYICLTYLNILYKISFFLLINKHQKYWKYFINVIKTMLFCNIYINQSKIFFIIKQKTYKGTKFIMTTDPEQTRVELYLKKIYEIYSDYVMKNPFYTPEMPIRCELFDVNVLRYIKSVNESP